MLLYDDKYFIGSYWILPFNKRGRCFCRCYIGDINKFKNTKNNLKRVDEKASDKDVVFIVDLEEPYDKLKVNLEMNNTKYISSITISRNVYYLSNFHSLGLKEKENYNKLLQTIQYNFNRGYVDKTNRNLIDEYYLRNKYGNILTEDIKIVHINVDELSKLWYSENRNKYSKNY